MWRSRNACAMRRRVCGATNSPPQTRECLGPGVSEPTVPDAILDQYYCYRGQRRQMTSKDRPEDRYEELVRIAFFQLGHLVHSALLFLSFL